MEKYKKLIRKAKENRVTDLSLSDDEIRDIHALSSLTHLRKLDLSGCEGIRDISPLASLKNLKELKLSACKKIRDIRPLSSLTRLKKLGLSVFRDIEDLAPLSSLVNLTELDLAGFKSIQYFHPLSSLKNLTKLSLSGFRNIKDIHCLSSLKNLKTLSFRKCGNIRDWRFLCALPNLEEWEMPLDIASALRHCPVMESHTDERGRLHNEKGPSIVYEGGLNLYYWHGVRIPKKWITGKLPSVTEALAIRYSERRRAACEMIGWGKIIKGLDAKVIDKNPDPEIGTLLVAKYPTPRNKSRFLKVKCGTGREFVLPVPPTMKTAHQANAWTWGLRASQYQPEIRT